MVVIDRVVIDMRRCNKASRGRSNYAITALVPLQDITEDSGRLKAGRAKVPGIVRSHASRAIATRKIIVADGHVRTSIDDVYLIPMMRR